MASGLDALPAEAWSRFSALLDEAPSIDRGEITDKGSLNQRAILASRAELIEGLYRGEDARLIPAP